MTRQRGSGSLALTQFNHQLPKMKDGVCITAIILYRGPSMMQGIPP